MPIYDVGDRNSRKGTDAMQNNGASAIAVLDPVVCDPASLDDVKVKTHNTSAEAGLFVGYALEAIPVGDFGKIQRNGYVKGVSVQQEAATAVVVGDLMKLDGSNARLIRSGVAAGVPGAIVAMTAVATGNAVVTMDVFIRGD